MLTEADLDMSRWPKVRIMDGTTVVARFRSVPVEEETRRWNIDGHTSVGQARRLFERGHRGLDELPREERKRIHRRDNPGHVADQSAIEVELIGDVPLEQAYRREWDGIAPEEIPGYRKVYELPGLSVRAERLYPILDGLAEAGISRVQLDHLRKLLR